MASVTSPAVSEQRFLLWDSNWQTYERFLEAIGERPVRVTYDRGKLEIMALSLGHERCGELLGQMVVAITDECDISRLSGGSTTFKREDLDRGLEADKCYYLENEPLVRGKHQIDLTIDPPPDLAIEIDITRSSIDRLAIYAALRVPEVWVYDGVHLKILRLVRGKYKALRSSRCFPFLPMKTVEEFLNQRNELTENELMKRFRRWLRAQQEKGWPKNGR